MRLTVNPELAFHPFHGDSVVTLMVCEVPDNSGRPRRYIVPRRLCELLPMCDGELERSRALTLMAEASDGQYTAEQLELLTEEFLIPRHLLLDPDAPIKPLIAARRLDRYLFFKVRFLKPGIVRPIASHLLWLFYPTAWKCLVPLIVFSHVWFYLILAGHKTSSINDLPNSSLPWFLLLFSLGGMLHEFGHATALARFGGKSGEIGFGIYICFAALFVDLSEAWRLTNWQRVIVDFSGLYFQGLFLVFMAIGYACTGWEVWACAFVFTDLEIAANLNPLLRLDGYWALADGLGIPNLRMRAMRYLLRPIIAQTGSDSASQLSPRTLAIIRVYLACALVFSCYLIYAVGAQSFAVLQHYPRMLRLAWESWHTGSRFTATFAALWRGMLLLSLAVLILRAVLWIVNNVRWNSLPRQRSGELLVPDKFAER